jgi:pimeloyl-ACP methyl ester carboxylesterase
MRSVFIQSKNMSRIKYILAVLIFVILILSSPLTTVYSAGHTSTGTRIGGTIDSDLIWTKEGSPYVLTDPLNITAGHKLTIGPGVMVTGDPSKNTQINMDQSDLEINGTISEPVNIIGIGHILIGRGTTTIRYAKISTSGIALQPYSSNVTISSSTFIASSATAIYSFNSNVKITGSKIKSDYYAGIIRLADSGPKTEFSIQGSSIIGNPVYAIRNDDFSSTIHAENNWWGNANGPSLYGANAISGQIVYIPWLTSEPVLDLDDEDKCCSSILFIPGLEASRLYRSESAPVIGATINRLWEPNRNTDVTKLYLDQDGKSIDPSIYSGEPIDRALGVLGVYGRFMSFLDDLAKKGTVNEWKAFGYDWRKPVSEVVAGNERRLATATSDPSFTNESLIDTVYDLASRSKTNKVTLIVHSNGGLVAKYLVKTLMDIGKESLIDSVISVAVPYLGTPQALLGLLHGGDQSIAYGLIVKESFARLLGVNMPSAYSLLPSREYFKNIFSPTVAFASTTIIGINNGRYSENINSFDEQSAFVTNSNNGRLEASSTDTLLAIKGNSFLMNAADVLHSILDPFTWPVTISRYAVVGWNRITAQGLSYLEKQKCLQSFFGMTCSAKPVHEKIVTNMGDGTVLAPSASYNSGTVVSVDLKEESKREKRGISHVNILEASTTIETIKRIIFAGSSDGQSSSSTTVLSSEELLQLPAGAKFGQPDYSSEPTFLVISTHSPVDLHIYDSDGNHTGSVPVPSGTEDIYQAYETDIPGSDYSLSESDDGVDTYIYVPDDGEKYSVVINGTGVGEFTMDVERRRGSSVLEDIGYPSMSVTPLMTASSSIISGGFSDNMPAGVSMIPLASSTAPLNIDVDGDGTRDISVTANSQFDPITYLESIKKAVYTLAGDLPSSKKLIGSIDRLESLIKDGKLGRAHSVANKMKNGMSHLKLSTLSDQDRQQILDMINLFVLQFE